MPKYIGCYGNRLAMPREFPYEDIVGIDVDKKIRKI